MANYKIKVIKHLLKGNKIAVSGDVVDGSQFINLQASLDGKYCEEHTESAKSKNESGDEPTELELEIRKIKKYNKEELTAFCVENEIEFDEQLNKKDLLKFVVDILETPAEKK